MRSATFLWLKHKRKPSSILIVSRTQIKISWLNPIPKS